MAGCPPTGARYGPNELSRVEPKRKKPVIGLAGGIGAGKSSVARILEALGAAVIDSDRIGHELLDDPEVVATVRRWWGDAVFTPNGNADRGAIAAIVFADPAELARLEALLYPKIGRRREDLMTAYMADPDTKAIVLDAPKLFEAHLAALCDAVIFVGCERSARLRRMAASRGWTEEEVTRRENSQIPLDKKEANADHVVVNNSGIDELRSQVENVFTSVLACFG